MVHVPPSARLNCVPLTCTRYEKCDQLFAGTETVVADGGTSGLLDRMVLPGNEIVSLLTASVVSPTVMLTKYVPLATSAVNVRVPEAVLKSRRSRFCGPVMAPRSVPETAVSQP